MHRPRRGGMRCPGGIATMPPRFGRDPVAPQCFGCCWRGGAGGVVALSLVDGWRLRCALDWFRRVFRMLLFSGVGLCSRRCRRGVFVLGVAAVALYALAVVAPASAATLVPTTTYAFSTTWDTAG